MTEAQADQLLKLDIEEHWRLAKQKFFNDKHGTGKAFNNLSASQQYLLTDLSFNGAYEGKRFTTDINGVKTKTGTLIDNIIKGNWSQIKLDSKNATDNKSYLRHSGGKLLTKRNDSTLKYFIEPNANATINNVIQQP